MTVEDATDDEIAAMPDMREVLRQVVQSAENPDVWNWNRWTLHGLAKIALMKADGRIN